MLEPASLRACRATASAVFSESCTARDPRRKDGNHEEHDRSNPVCILAACGGENTPSSVATPGVEKDAKTRTLEAGAALMRDKTPLGKLNAYLDGFHFYSGNFQGQMEAHHYCEEANEELKQCRQR